MSFSAVITFLTSSATPTTAPAQIGIAAAYPGDKNIASNAAVIFADDFESYTTPDEAKTKWGNGNGTQRMRIATETANVFSGGKSIEMALPISTAEISCGFIRTLSPEQDTLFMRAYQKYDANYNSVNASNHNGLLLSGKYPGTPTIPPADGTGFFLFYLQNSFAKLAGETVPGYTEVYSYWPKQRSQYGDHFYPDGSFQPWIAGMGTQAPWLVYPAQYPDFKPYPMFIPQRGRWYCYELMVKTNTPGQNNGEVKFWIDGKVAGDFPNLFIRSIDTLKIDNADIGLHATNVTQPLKKWYDNVVIATKYIGPMASPSPSPTPTPPGQTAIWYLNNGLFMGSAFAPTLPANWRVVGVADFNRDGKADYLLYNASTRQTAIWYLSGPTLISGAYGPMIASGYTLIGAADFNADGKPDYVLYGPSVQGTTLWYLDNNVFTGSANGPTLPAGWSLTQR